MLKRTARAAVDPVPNKKRSEKLQVMLDEDELRIVEEWRFEHRLPSRAAAIRELIRRGLANSEPGEPVEDMLGLKSTDFQISVDDDE